MRPHRLRRGAPPRARERDAARRPSTGRAASALLAATLLTALTGACVPDAEEATPAADGGATRVAAAAEEAAAPVAALRYEGSSSCASCHPDEAAAWEGSHHALAMQEARPDTVLGDFAGARLPADAGVSGLVRADGRFRVLATGPDGSPGRFDVGWTFGIRPLQQYLVPLPDGRLQALGLAWDTRPADDGGQRWRQLFPDASPGDPLHWTGIDQTANAMCVECHVTGFEKGYDAERDRYATRWSEAGVGCEACHGPGSAHVAWAREASIGGAGPRAKGDPGPSVHFDGRGDWQRAPGAAIARLTEARVARHEVDACGRCHARRARLVARDEPGLPFLDAHHPALLDDPALYFADGQIRDEVYVWGSFLQSRMFAAGVSCSDCHDPHALRIETPEAACARCHDPAVFAVPAHHHHEPGSAGARCVACHMPDRVYMQVDARRDHGFRVPRPDLAAKLGTPDACSACHAGRDATWSAQVVRGWFPEGRSGRPHFAEAIDAGRRGAIGAHAALAAVAADPAEPAIVRASALRLLGGTPGPQARERVRAGATDPDPLVRLAAVEAARSLPPAVALAATGRLLDDPRRVVRVEAASMLSAIPPSLWKPRERAALAAALEDHAAVQAANADRPESHLNRGLIHVRFDEWEAAQRAYEQALRLDPRFTPAAANLADLYRATGREEHAEQVLREALASEPEAAALHHALGLSLVRQGRREEALAALARAATLAPDVSRHAYVHALALHDAGRRGEALAVLRDAHARHEGDRDLLLALATLLRDEGRAAEALGYARALAAQEPGSREAAALVAELEARASPGDAAP